MLAQNAILDAARRAASAASSPASVVLFGSYARGDADEGSDLDFLVIEQEVLDKSAEYLRLHRAIGAMGVGVDVLVMSSEEFARRSQVPGTLPYWAAKEGKLIHDAIGFHAQQAVEKALKAVCTQHGIEVRRTHDLAALAQALANHGVALPVSVDEVRALNPFAVEFRYDDEISSATNREELDAIVPTMLYWARQQLSGA